MIVPMDELIRAIRGGGNSPALTSEQIDFLAELQSAVEGEVAQIIGYPLATGTRTEYLPKSYSNRDREDEDLPGTTWGVYGNRAVRETRGGSETREIGLMNLPVRSITSVHENFAAWQTGEANGDFGSGYLLATSLYHLDLDEPSLSRSGILRRNSGGWSVIPRTVKIVYVSGYSTDEIETELPEVKQAIKMSVTKLYLDAIVRMTAASRGGLIASSTSITDFSTSFFDPTNANYGGFGSNGTLLPDEAKRVIARRINLSRYLR